MIFAINSGAFTISAQTISFAEKLQVLLEKNDIEELKNALNNLNKQTHNYSVEEIKSRENTFAMEEKIKSLKVNIENENNIVTDMKQKVKELKMKVVALRKILDPPSAKFSLFLKDVAKLISHKPI